MKATLRIISSLLIFCVSLVFWGCANQNADSGWISRTGWYGSMSNTGYYYTNKTDFLYYVDFKSNVNVSLCQKVGCTHKDSGSCEAYLKTERVLFWGDHLYYLADDIYGTHLYRRDATGQSLSAIGTLCEDIMQEERDIQINIVDTLITNGFLYYYAMVSKMEQTEDGLSTVGYRDVIRRIDLVSGKETTIVESQDSRLEMYGVRGQEILYSSVLMPEGLMGENAAELLKNTTTKMIIRNMESGEERLLFEKHRDVFEFSTAFVDGKLFYLRLDGDQRINIIYDVDTGEETELPTGFLTVIDNRYALLRNKEFHYTLLDMQKDQELPVALENAALSVYCAADHGVIFKYSDRTAAEEKKKLLRYAYVTSEDLADGLQESDFIVFYQTEIG